MRFFRTAGYYLKSICEMIVHFRNWLTLWPVFLRHQTDETRLLYLRRPPLAMKIRGRMDIWSIKETFLDQFYTRYGAVVEDGWTVVDVGAGVGDFSIFAGYNRPHTVVYALEPFGESYQLLSENLVLNAIDNVTAFPLALWGESGDLVLDLSGGEPLQIISQVLENQAEISGMTVVHALTLQDFLNQESIDHVDLMKLDCEGAEYEILMQASSQTLAKVDRVIMEYHDIREHNEHRVLASFLENEGYRIQIVENVVHEEIGYLYAERLQGCQEVDPEV